MTLPIQIPAEPLASLCRRYGVRRLSLFGSVLRPDFSSASHVDVLVEFPPGHAVGLFRLAAMERELCELVGRRVELRTPNDLSPYFRAAVLESAVEQYAA